MKKYEKILNDGRDRIILKGFNYLLPHLLRRITRDSLC